MEEYELDDIIGKKMNIFNLSWNTLNNNCRKLEEYSKFIQKYLDTLNQYFMSLTELNVTFPKFSSEYSENEFDPIIKNIGQILQSSIQNQLNNLLIFLSQSQALVHSLNQSILQTTNFIKKAKEINENVYSNIKRLNDNYHKEYTSMINSFENLENKLVENYIKIHYKYSDISENDENSLKNCVLISKKLENSLINFNKDKIRNYIEQYNSNLKDIKYNRDILNKNYYDCILSIMNNLIEYFNNLMNEIHANISLLNEYNENEDIFDFQISEKEVNSIIFKLFNSKKYNIKIIHNTIINYKQTTNENQNNLRNLTFILSEEDIYNIIKEIYNYDFISINKSDYVLENEKEKLKILDLTKKLLSYNLHKGQVKSITEEEIKELNNILNDNDDYILYFLSVLNQSRAQSIYEMPKKIFDIITNIFQKSLKQMEKNKNLEIGVNIITLSFSFFMKEGKEKYYFGDIVKKNKIFNSSKFWNDYTNKQIENDLKRINIIKNTNKNISDEISNKNIYDILLSKILPSADTMSKFGLEKKEIINIIEPLLDKYQMKQNSKQSLLSLIKNQIEI